MSTVPASNRHVRTKRLRLAPVRLEDLQEIAALLSDERVWGHFPSGRHSSLEETREWLVDSSGRWVTDRLGYWTARLQVPIDSLTTGTFAGVGGCAMSTRGNWWNLYYRLRPELHRRGLASELCQVALAAARDTQPQLPVVAFLLEHNHASNATAQGAGLQLVWRGPDRGNPTMSAIRLIYADRPLDRTQLDVLISTVDETKRRTTAPP